MYSQGIHHSLPVRMFWFENLCSIRGINSFETQSRQECVNVRKKRSWQKQFWVFDALPFKDHMISINIEFIHVVCSIFTIYNLETTVILFCIMNNIMSISQIWMLTLLIYRKYLWRLPRIVCFLQRKAAWKLHLLYLHPSRRTLQVTLKY